MPAGVAGAATAVSEMRRKKRLMDAGHILWEDTPGLDRGEAIMEDRFLSPEPQAPKLRIGEPAKAKPLPALTRAIITKKRR